MINSVRFMVPPFGHIFPRGTPKWIHGRCECSIDISSKNVTDIFQIVSAPLIYLLEIQNDSTYLDFMRSYLYFMFSLLFETVRNQECSRIADAGHAFHPGLFSVSFPTFGFLLRWLPKLDLGPATAHYTPALLQPWGCLKPKAGLMA